MPIFDLSVFNRFQSPGFPRWIVATRFAVRVAAVCCVITPAAAQVEGGQVAGPPAEVAANYHAAMDADVSEDFDALDPAKWVVRARKGDDPTKASGNIKSKHNQIRKEKGSGYLSLLADKAGEAGVSALHAHAYGFTVCRWRTRGLEYGKKHAAHPAIWSFSYNMGSDPRNAPNANNKTLEIDWMEYIKWQKVPGYHARIIPADEGISDTKRSVYMIQNQTDFDGWRIHGYEYTPDYVQLWELVNDQWQKKGVELRFDDTTDIEGKALDREYRSKQYFVLSNIWFYKPEYELNPVRLEIDYLHHYPVK